MPVLVDILFFALASVFFTFAMSVIDRVLGISGIKCPICRGKSCKEKYFGGFFAIFACLKCGTRFVIDDGVSALPEELRAVRHPGLRAIRLLEQEYEPEQAENLTRKLLNAIRTRDTGKFSRSVRRTHADS